jgi:hypothetical protein
MKNISIKDFAAFIEAQPDEREIRMEQFDSKFFVGEGFCGCVMIHYGKEVLKIKESFACGNTDFLTFEGDESKVVAKLPFTIPTIVGSPENYGQAKNYLKKIKVLMPDLFA